MNKNQALLVTAILVLMLTYTLPLFLADFEVGFDIPLFGHVSIFEPSTVFGTFLAGAISSIIIFYALVNDRRGKN